MSFATALRPCGPCVTSSQITGCVCPGALLQMTGRGQGFMVPSGFTYVAFDNTTLNTDPSAYTVVTSSDPLVGTSITINADGYYRLTYHLATLASLVPTDTATTHIRINGAVVASKTALLGTELSDDVLFQLSRGDVIQLEISSTAASFSTTSGSTLNLQKL